MDFGPCRTGGITVALGVHGLFKVAISRGRVCGQAKSTAYVALTQIGLRKSAEASKEVAGGSKLITEPSVSQPIWVRSP